MLEAIGTGVVAALLVAFARLLHVMLPQLPWYLPTLTLAPIGVALFFYRSGRRYGGLTDLFFHVHSPNPPRGLDTPLRWGSRAAITFLFNMTGSAVGIEGAAIEATQALALGRRSRALRWSEQVRRTDAASAIAAGIAAAFGAPFAAFLLAMELGIGGRALSAGTAAISAFITLRLVWGSPLETFDVTGALYGFKFHLWREWVGTLVIAGLASLLGIALIRLRGWVRDNLSLLGGRREVVRLCLGGVLLLVLAYLYRPGHLGPSQLLEQTLWARRSTGATTLALVTESLGLLFVLGGFGTIGIFWPIFAIGGLFGFAFNAAILGALPGFAGSGFGAAAGMVGASAIFGATIGAPLAGGWLAFEMTQNFYILLPCLIAAQIGNRLRIRMGQRSWIESGLERRGLKLVGGRIAAILDAIRVSDAMVTDCETVDEKETVAELHGRLLKGRYPFLPVVNRAGVYQGLLTVDLVEDAWQAEDPQAAHSPLARLLEAKDLLYRSGQKIPTVQAGDSLSAVVAHFNRYPCLAVVDSGGQVTGLLFVHNVRLSYDREVARRALVPSA